MIVNITMPKSRKIRVQQSVQHFGLLSLLGFGKKSNSLQNFVKFAGRSFTVSESSGSTVPIKIAPDVWESARFRSIFLASSRFASCLQAESTPAHTQSTQAVGRNMDKMINKISELALTIFG